MNPSASKSPRLAVVGAGWAGLAAAVRATEAGARVTLFEAARAAGGRARGLPPREGHATVLDNGQHILIGAYARALALMETIGVNPALALDRRPLALVYPDGMGLRLPPWRPPWNALWGLATAHGWSPSERLRLLMRATAWQLGGFRCDPDRSVAELCAGLPAPWLARFIEPLCVSALNLPAAQASAAVFLRVLRDAMFDAPGGSDLLLPRVDLGALLPEPALAWLAGRGAETRIGQRVRAIEPNAGRWQLDSETFDAVVLAVPVWEAVRLIASVPAGQPWTASAGGLRHTAIATVYLRTGTCASSAPGLAEPMLALDASDEEPAQFLFDRGRLGGPAGLLAFVVSAAHGERAAIEAAVLRQAKRVLRRDDLVPVATVLERRATFACVPGLRRPPMRIAPALVAAGDYVEGPYPATLEGAVRSGEAAAAEALRAASEPPAQ